MTSDSTHASAELIEDDHSDNPFTSVDPVKCQTIIRQVFEALRPMLEQGESTKEVQGHVEELRKQMHSLVDLFGAAAADGMKTYTNQMYLLQQSESPYQIYSIPGIKDAIEDSKKISKNGLEGTTDIAEKIAQIHKSCERSTQVDLQLKINEEVTKQSRGDYAQVAVTSAGEVLTESGGGLASKVLKFFLSPLVAMGVKGLKDNIQREKAQSQKQVESCQTAMTTVENIKNDANSVYYLIRELYRWWIMFQRAVAKFERTLMRNIQNDILTRSMSPYHKSLQDILGFMQGFSGSIKEVLIEAPSNPIICSRDLESDPTMNSQLTVFRSVVGDILELFASLETSQSIIGHSHHRSFGKSVQGLREALLNYFPMIQAVLDPWAIHSDSGSTFQPDVEDSIVEMDRARDVFTSTAACKLSEIGDILSTKTSSLRTVPAKSKQSDEEENGISKFKGKRVATKSEGLEVHQKLSHAVKVITDFSRELGLAIRHYADEDGEISNVLFKSARSSDGTLVKHTGDSLQFLTHSLKSTGIVP